ncbi:MAG TPA: hypothetical protein VF039_10050 [Longimicrobiales bacterium]
MSQRGFALITVVLLMIGLAVLSSALAFSAAQQIAVRASLHDLVRARTAAGSGAAAAVDAWSSARRALDPVGLTVAIGDHAFERDVRVRVASTRLAGNAWLIDVEATVARGAEPAIVRRARRIVRGLDVDSVGAAFDAAAIAARVHVGDGALVNGLAAGDPSNEYCAHWSSDGAALRAPPESTLIDAGADVAGAPILAADAEPERYRRGLGVFERASLIALALGLDGPELTPAPVHFGATCDTSVVSNWGAPDGPCAGRFVLARAPGSVTIDGGYGQGVLLVSGDVVLDGGFVFHGLIIAEGGVTVRDAEVHGSIAAAALEIGARGLIRLDRCAVAAALARTPALGRALVPPRSWLPPLD